MYFPNADAGSCLISKRIRSKKGRRRQFLGSLSAKSYFAFLGALEMPTRPLRLHSLPLLPSRRTKHISPVEFGACYRHSGLRATHKSSFHVKSLDDSDIAFRMEEHFEVDHSTRDRDWLVYSRTRGGRFGLNIDSRSASQPVGGDRTQVRIQNK